MKRESSDESPKGPNRDSAEIGTSCFDRWFETCGALLESLPMAICTMDLKGQLRWTNSAFSELTGLNPDAATNTTLWERAITEAERRACQAACQQICSLQPAPPTFPCCLSRPDGTIVHAQVSWQYQRDSNNVPQGILCLLSDMTDHVTATRALADRECELRQTHAELERVLATIPDYLWSLHLDQNGTPTKVYFSPVVEKITGQCPEQYRSVGLTKQLEIVHPDECERVKSWLEALPSSGCTSTLEYRIIHTDGSTRWVHDSAVTTQLEDGSRRIDGVATDVTQRRRSEAERIGLESKIQQAQKLESLGVLAGGIAHDFNNLLVGMLGNAELAKMELAPESPAREYVRSIELTAKRASDLIRQMLAYSGKGRFVIERIDLGAIVEEMVHLLQISILKKVVLKLDVSKAIPHVEADATQVRQVVMNLVTNASEAIGDRSGVVQIATGVMECDRSYLKETYLDDNLPEGLYSFIEVSDTGVGMPEATKTRIFDPFFTTKFTGRGLGLAAVLGIVRGHRGAIKVYTEPEKGTTFKVLLPALEKESSEPKLHSDSVNAAWSGHAHVLLVDDEPTVRAVAKAMLEKLGCTVESATNGQEAVEMFQRAPTTFDFVVLDLTMPYLDGEQAFRELKRINKDIRVLLSSGYSEQDLLGRFAGKGLAGFIQKPYRLGVLARKIKETLG